MTLEQGKQFHALHVSGATYAAISAGSQPHVSVGTVGRRIREYRAALGAETLTERARVPLPSPKLYIYRGQTPEQEIPVFTGAERIVADEIMVTGDLHLPTTKFWFLDRMCRVAERHMQHPRRLLIVGDPINGDADSNHPRRYPSVSRMTEYRIAEQTIDFLLDTFDEIKLTPGNHFRNRLFEVLEGDVDMERALRLITPHTSRVHLSAYDIAHVRSDDQEWTFTHQYQYSVNKLIKANELAQKYQTNLATFHQHHTAMGMDRYGRYVIMDIGGLHESAQMAYVSLVPNSLPVMNSGFVLLRRGTAHLLTPYKGMTDWGMWLSEKDIAETQPREVSQQAA